MLENSRLQALCSTFAAIALLAPSCSEQAEPDQAEETTVSQANAAGENTLYPDVEFAPVFDDSGELLQPENFRRWTFLGTPITPNGLNNGQAGFPEYHNVYVQPSAFDYYRANGVWPDGTMMVKELQLVKGGGTFGDGSRTEPSGRGFFPAAVNGIDVAVKDSSRFGETQNWGYFNFGHHAPPYASSAPAMPKEACAQCHIDTAHNDMTFVEFYAPILTPLPTSADNASVGGGVYDRYVDGSGNISLPDDFDSWRHIGSWAVAKDGGVEGLHNVYATDGVIEHYQMTGTFPDGAMLVKEVRAAEGAAHTTGDAHWATDVQVWFAMIKDSQGRFPDNALWGDGWGWALFEGQDRTKQVAGDYKEDCLGCHVPAEDTDWVYVYAYPSLGDRAAATAPQKEAAASAAVSAMTTMAAASDESIVNGEAIFARCAACHSLTPGRHTIGPSLAGMFGRKAGSAEGYNYSAAMSESDVIWSVETLDAHLADVKGFIPGNRMASLYPAGVQDPEERAAVIAYLHEAAGN